MNSSRIRKETVVKYYTLINRMNKTCNTDKEINAFVKAHSMDWRMLYNMRKLGLYRVKYIPMVKVNELLIAIRDEQKQIKAKNTPITANPFKHYCSVNKTKKADIPVTKSYDFSNTDFKVTNKKEITKKLSLKDRFILAFKILTKCRYARIQSS